MELKHDLRGGHSEGNSAAETVAQPIIILSPSRRDPHAACQSCGTTAIVAMRRQSNAVLSTRAPGDNAAGAKQTHKE
jgi:hypothetical protein